MYFCPYALTTGCFFLRLLSLDASQSAIILFHPMSINLIYSKLLPPTFCPLALVIISNNHIQDLVPNTINWSMLRDYHVRLPQAFCSMIAGKLHPLLPCFSLYLCCWKIPWKIEFFADTYSTGDQVDYWLCLWKKIQFWLIYLGKVYL